MLKKPDLEYGVYHIDTFEPAAKGTSLIGEFDKFKEAERFVFKKYGPGSKDQKIMQSGADRVHIVHFVDGEGSVVAEFNVG